MKTLIIVFSIVFIIILIRSIFAAGRSNRTNRGYYRDNSGAGYIPAAGLIDNNNPAPDSGSTTGPSHFDAGSHGSHTHSHDSGGGHSHGGFDGGGHSHSSGSFDGGSSSFSGGDTGGGGGCSGGDGGGGGGGGGGDGGGGGGS
jgi:hypothetical protein